MAVSEDQFLLSLAARRENSLHLLRTHGQHLELDAVELVEAAPAAGHRETLVDLAHRTVVQLVRAVEHHDELAKSTTKVLNSLGLACPRRPRRSATKEHPKGLCERDVAAVGERRNTQALFAAKVLVAILEVHIGNRDQTVVDVQL